MKRNIVLVISLGFLLFGCVGPDDDGEIGHYIRVAQKARNSNNPEAALSFYNKAKQIDPSNATVYLGLAQVYLDMKLIDASTEFLKRAESLGADIEKVGYIRGKMYLLSGNIESAEKEFLKFPDNPDCLNALGAICDNKKNHELAQKYYRRVISIEPNYIDAYNNLGLSYMLQGKYKDAIFYLENACSLPDANMHYRSNLALVYGLNGEMNKAREVYARDFEEADLEEKVARLEDKIANR